MKKITDYAGLAPYKPKKSVPIGAIILGAALIIASLIGVVI